VSKLRVQRWLVRSEHDEWKVSEALDRIGFGDGGRAVDAFARRLAREASCGLRSQVGKRGCIDEDGSGGVTWVGVREELGEQAAPRVADHDIRRRDPGRLEQAVQLFDLRDCGAMPR
jgi:hypothetical protein